jgi:hypothetical protein
VETLEVEARIANPPPGLLAKYTKKERNFFSDYATFVQRQLTSGLVHKGLRTLIDKEGISPGRAIDLRIMVFPAKPLTGRSSSILHGSYNQDSAQISIYPLKVPRDWVRRNGSSLFTTAEAKLTEEERGLLGKIFENAVSTLIHEVLHVKFEVRGYSRYSEEAIVRKLEKQYFQELFGSAEIPL